MMQGRDDEQAYEHHLEDSLILIEHIFWVQQPSVHRMELSGSRTFDFYRRRGKHGTFL